MKAVKYIHDSNPPLVPLTEGDWNEDLVKACGENPDDDEIVCCELSEEWNGHPAGSKVVTGCTLQGHSFTVIEM